MGSIAAATAGPGAYAAFQAYMTYVNGGTLADIVRTAAISYVTASATNGIDSSGADKFAIVMGNGAVGGIEAAFNGGSFEEGFKSAAISKIVTLNTPRVSSDPGQFAITVMSGGIASQLGGGKFEDGARSAAMGYLFDEMTANSKSGIPKKNKLSQETKDLLEPYFSDLNLNDVYIIVDQSMVPDGMGAITLFGNVYMTPNSYNPTDPGGVALIGHELLHVQQQKDAGIGFYIRYGAEYLGGRLQGVSDRAAYYSISYEASAYRLQSQMNDDFRERLLW